MPALQSIDVVAAKYMGIDSIWPTGGFSYRDLWGTMHASLATAGYQVRVSHCLNPFFEILHLLTLTLWCLSGALEGFRLKRPVGRASTAAWPRQAPKRMLHP